MKWLVLICLVLNGWAAVADERPVPVPSMYPNAWTWAALYGSVDGTAVVLAMTDTSGTRLDLRKGRPPAPAVVTIDTEGRLSDGLQVQDRARRIVQPDLPLVARWVRVTRSTGFDTVTVTVPIPERLDDPLRVIFVDHQAKLVCDAQTWMEPANESPRSTPAEEPLPTATWRFTDDVLTEVAWWSADLVSTLDWRVCYSGGAHANTTLIGHTWRRDSTGAWRPLSLDEYLGPSATWKAALVRAITDDLVRQQAGWLVDNPPTARPSDDSLLRVWSVSGDALVFSFPPYEVGPFAQGVFQVRIPWRTVGRDRP